VPENQRLLRKKICGETLRRKKNWKTNICKLTFGLVLNLVPTSFERAATILKINLKGLAMTMDVLIMELFGRKSEDYIVGHV
jgi:hypothetical protein